MLYNKYKVIAEGPLPGSEIPTDFHFKSLAFQIPAPDFFSNTW
jgi:hypothetical protein